MCWYVKERCILYCYSPRVEPEPVPDRVAQQSRSGTGIWRDDGRRVADTKRRFRVSGKVFYSLGLTK